MWTGYFLTQDAQLDRKVAGRVCCYSKRSNTARRTAIGSCCTFREVRPSTISHIQRAHNTPSIAINLVNSSTRHIYDSRTRTYLQPDFTKEVLSRFVQVNKGALSSLKLTKPFKFGDVAIPVGAPLLLLAQSAALSDPAAAPAILEAVLEELHKQKTYVSRNLHSAIWRILSVLQVSRSVCRGRRTSAVQPHDVVSQSALRRHQAVAPVSPSAHPRIRQWQETLRAFLPSLELHSLDIDTSW